MRYLTPLVLFTALALLPGCASRKTYPDSAPGWHAPDYSTVFGRLQRVPGKNPDDPASWMIRYGFNADDSYGGKFNLTPTGKMTGYNGGELIEVRGHRLPDMKQENITGMWYQVDSIRLWVPSKPR